MRLFKFIITFLRKLEGSFDVSERDRKKQRDRERDGEAERQRKMGRQRINVLLLNLQTVLGLNTGRDLQGYLVT